MTGVLFRLQAGAKDFKSGRLRLTQSLARWSAVFGGEPQPNTITILQMRI
jgi:hypothetical protein